MKTVGRTITLLFLVGGMLSSCNGFRSTATLSPTELMETAISTASTALAETQQAVRTATPPVPLLPTVAAPVVATQGTYPTPLPSSTSIVFTDPSIPLSERIIFYRAVAPGQNPIPEGTVLAGQLFAPTHTDETYTADIASDLTTALEFILHDRDGIWEISDIEVTVRNAHADVVLQGEYHVAGGGQLWAASWQILMTIFANPSVQTATVTFNGIIIGNLGISRSEDAKPDNYIYPRAEIETYMRENTYEPPVPSQ
jgi:hypothetical protein